MCENAKNKFEKIQKIKFANFGTGTENVKNKFEK
jgi:hypothetical protein